MILTDLAFFDSNGPKPIAYQILMKFLLFIKSREFQDWATRMESQQPQLPFVVIQYIESATILLGKAGQNFLLQDACQSNDFNNAKIHHFEQAVEIFCDFKKDMRQLIRTHTVEARVPRTTPKEYDPREISAKKQKAATATTAAPSAPANPTAQPSAARNTRRLGAPMGQTRNDLGCVFARDVDRITVQDFFPDSLRAKYCMSWMLCGRRCGRPIGMCKFSHAKLDALPDHDRTAMIAHVMGSPDLWFNAKSVKKLDEKQRHKLGNDAGPTGASS